MAIIIYIALELKKFSFSDACRIRREAAKIANIYGARRFKAHPDLEHLNYPIIH